jgi:hypothetical protein
MTTKKEIYSEEYQRIINEKLAKHPKYKTGMEVSFADTKYGMALKTPVVPVTSEEIEIFLEVLSQVEKDYKLIHI